MNDNRISVSQVVAKLKSRAEELRRLARDTPGTRALFDTKAMECESIVGLIEDWMIHG